MDRDGEEGTTIRVFSVVILEDTLMGCLDPTSCLNNLFLDAGKVVD